MLSERVATHFTGRPMLARRPQHQRVVRERPALQAEAAADVGRHHADLVLRHVEDVRHLHAHAVRILRGGIERVVVLGRVVIADRDARLHRDRREPVVLDPQLDHVLGLGEGGVGRGLVAEHQPEADIALRVVVPDLGRAVLGGVLESRPPPAAARTRPRPARRRRAPASASRPPRRRRGRRRSAPGRRTAAAGRCGGPWARRSPPASDAR